MTANPATTHPAGITGAEILGRYSTYGAAQHIVDALSDGGFPVEHVSIVGDDLRSVEQVIGRMTIARAAVLGAAQGVWMGLVLTAIISIVTPVGWSLLFVTPLAAAGGAILGGGLHAATRGSRDFTSTQEIRAGSYAVLVNSHHTEQARRLLEHAPA